MSESRTEGPADTLIGNGEHRSIMKRFRHLEVTGPETRLKSNFIRGIRGLPVIAHRH